MLTTTISPIYQSKNKSAKFLVLVTADRLKVFMAQPSNQLAFMRVPESVARQFSGKPASGRMLALTGHG